MGKRIFLTAVWVGFIVYAFWFAPPQQPGTTELILRLSSGDWEGLNPAIIALFNAMGIWPLIYLIVALVDGHNQKVPAWPFVLGSFGLGAFLLLPYLILRTPNPRFTGTPSWLLVGLQSRWVGGFLLVAAVGVMGYGGMSGDWADWADQWRQSRFIHVMSWDFCLLWLLFPVLLKDDMARRGWQSSTVFWVTAALPLVGPAGYLLLRPPLPAESLASAESTTATTAADSSPEMG